MKIYCEIIKDLIPLYHDGVCSQESRTMVEEHLAECDHCKAELQVMDEVVPLNNITQNRKEAEAIKALSKKWRKDMLKSLLKGVSFTILTVAIVALILYIFIGIKYV